MAIKSGLITWILRFICSIILIQTLFFKFSAAEESVYIFSKLGLEPSGRILTGIAELVAAILLLIPRVSWAGALMTTALMAGAIFFHLTTLGIEVRGDGGQLFLYAVVVFLCAIVLVVMEKPKLIRVLRRAGGRSN